MTTQTKQIISILLPSLAFIAFLILANGSYIILSNSDVNALIDQCHIVREDYQAALRKLDPSDSENPQTGCFDSLADMRETKKLRSTLIHK